VTLRQLDIGLPKLEAERDRLRKECRYWRKQIILQWTIGYAVAVPALALLAHVLDLSGPMGAALATIVAPLWLRYAQLQDGDCDREMLASHVKQLDVVQERIRAIEAAEGGQKR
jgi:hypothetical protein